MGYRLTIEPLGQTVEVEDGRTLLDASLRAGVYLPHACCHGLCATCKVQVLDGEIDHGEASNFALMDYEREEGKCLACCALPRSDITIEADVEIDPDARSIAVRDFSGTVRRVEALTPTIKGVWIDLDAGQEIDFQAGQYVNVKLPTGETRPFSLANPPSRCSEVELHVRLVPGGKATTWIHEELRPGDAITLSGPYGRFFVRKSAAAPSLFLAGGSGLSSPLSMIRDLLAEGSEVPVTLVHGARSRRELYCVEELEALAAAHRTFRYVPVVSEESLGSDWTGARGLVHAEASKLFAGDFRGHKAYLCGPPAMIDACIGALMRGRLFERDIYTERFISAADTQRARSPLFKRI